MPVHDGTRVGAGVYHDFHNVWIGALRNALNGGLLPSGYYAMSEQHAGKYITDVITLHGDTPTPAAPPTLTSGGVAVADAPPKVRRQLSLSGSARSLRKTLTVRHISGHRIVALLEMVLPANKDRREHVEEFVDKLENALRLGIHLLVVDLFPPKAHDPHGIHGAVWERLGDESDELPVGEPMTLAAYVASSPIRAYLEHLAAGHVLPEMPLFLDPGHYVNVPLEPTYETTWQGTPQHWRRILEHGT